MPLYPARSSGRARPAFPPANHDDFSCGRRCKETYICSIRVARSRLAYHGEDSSWTRDISPGAAPRCRVLLMLFGQFFAGTSDYFLSIENPRPLDDNITTITIYGWGFASRVPPHPHRGAGRPGLCRRADVRHAAAGADVALHLRRGAAGEHRVARQRGPASAGAGLNGHRQDRRPGGLPGVEDRRRSLGELPQDRDLQLMRRYALRSGDAGAAATTCPGRAPRCGSGCGKAKERGRPGAAGGRRLVALQHPARPGRVDAEHPPLQPLLSSLAADGFRAPRSVDTRRVHAGGGRRPGGRGTTTSWRRWGAASPPPAPATARPFPAPAPPAPTDRCSPPAASSSTCARCRWSPPAASGGSNRRPG